MIVLVVVNIQRDRREQNIQGFLDGIIWLGIFYPPIRSKLRRNITMIITEQIQQIQQSVLLGDHYEAGLS